MIHVQADTDLCFPHMLPGLLEIVKNLTAHDQTWLYDVGYGGLTNLFFYTRSLAFAWCKSDYFKVFMS